jgi:signal transduction histidine kinase
MIQKEFINIAAHEMKTPIQPIISCSYMLKNKVQDDKGKELLEIIYRNAQRAMKMSEDVLDLTKIESNSLRLIKENFAVREIIYDIIINYQSNAGDNGIKITCDISDSLIVYGDKNRISQVISNLVNNSIKFSSSPVSISLKAESKITDIVTGNDKEMVVVSIKDAGNGIDPGIFNKLFTKFATTSSQGIGLGLYISKKIVEAHGGVLWAENNRDGRGATFSFSLPI